MAAGAREREQVGHGRSDLDDLGLGRPPAPHRDDDDPPLARQHAGDVAGDGRLADPLAGPDHGHGGRPDRLEARRLEPEVGAFVRHAEREGARGEPEARRRPEHRLVGEVEHDVGGVLGDRLLERGGERNAVVLPAAQLLRAADENARDDLVGQLDESIPDHGGVVLPVDHGNGPHERDVTSDSIRPVYFSYSKVSVENWMMRSCPWNGWRRQISTWLPVISITL